MDLVQVYVIGVEAAQGIVYFLEYPLLRGVAERAIIVPLNRHLGRDPEIFAPAVPGDGLADDFLGAPEAVHGRRVDQVDALLAGGVDGAYRGGLVAAAPHPPADRPGAEPDAGGPKSRFTDFHAFHCRRPLKQSLSC